MVRRISILLFVISVSVYGQDGTKHEHLGVHLPVVNDWTSLKIFADQVKHIRHWQPIGDGELTTDAMGWPTTDARNFMSMIRTVPQYSGVYKFRFRGRGDFRPSHATLLWSTYYPDSNMTHGEFEFTDSHGTWWTFEIRNSARNPGEANTGFTDLQIMLPGHEFGETYSHELAKALEPFNLLRCMGVLKTNDHEDVTGTEWVDVDDLRPRDFYNQSDPGSDFVGISHEWLIDIANTLEKDLWINFPHNCTDEYIAEVARLYRDNLDPDRHVYLEYSNEAWGYHFNVARWASARANIEAAAGDSSLYTRNPQTGAIQATNETRRGWRRSARRFVEISRIWQSVWGTTRIDGTFRPLFVWQRSGDMHQKLLGWIHDRFGPPHTFFYGTAQAAYFGPTDESSVDAVIQTAIQAHHDQKVPDMIGMCSVASYYRLQPMVYEGGGYGTGPDNEGDITTVVQANRDPRIKDVYRAHYTDWFEFGGKGYCELVLCATWKNAGFWGGGMWALAELGSELEAPPYPPKWEVFREMASEPYPAPTKGIALPLTVGQTVSIDNRENIWRPYDNECSQGTAAYPDPYDYVPSQQGTFFFTRAPRGGTYAVSYEMCGSRTAAVYRALYVDNDSIGRFTVSPGNVTSQEMAVVLEPGYHTFRLVWSTGTGPANDRFLHVRLDEQSATVASGTASLLRPYSVSRRHDGLAIRFATPGEHMVTLYSLN
ncbi:MAG: hypothetical protein GF331_06190, partial [Chitinivibrionales bacterium]|nr:hypothetical protein [Chitinivibrionales bacterium]